MHNIHIKDLPDIEGDLKFNVKTFASTYGVKKIATWSSFSLMGAYITAISLPFIAPKGSFKMLPMSGGHFLLFLYFLNSFKQSNFNDIKSVKTFYKKIWNLFYLEYCLYPLI